MKPVDLLYMGLGAAFLAKDKFEEFVDEMEKRGEMSRTEAKNFLEDARARAKQEEEAVNARIHKELQKVLEGMGLATKEDIAELKALIEKKSS
ncbi:phasin family protein [Solidesulfovibrio sp. C21]|uniref:phasin family protein n=1 Tax=Solidesulfovibrio sp. C21 TaxID=3398613 RepID=UPI0039FC7C1B